MKLIPPLTTTLPGATSPGELIRIRHGRGQLALGIVASSVHGFGIVCLDLDPAEPSPGFLLIGTSHTDSMLSYGQDYAFHIPASVRVLTGFDQGFRADGLLIIDQDQALIRVRSLFHGMPGGFLNIRTGQFLDTARPSIQSWALLDWEIRLTSASPDVAPVYAFSASS